MEIPYWFNRQVEIIVTRTERRNGKRTIMITPMFRSKLLVEQRGDCNWYYKRWWLIDLPF